MNMFKSTDAKTAEEYIAKFDGETKENLQILHDFIRKTVPTLKPYIISGMIGYGTYHYKYASGREGDWCIIGLAKQKNYFSLYACATEGDTYIAEKYKDKLPKTNIGKSCIRFKSLNDLDMHVLKEILEKCEKAYA